MMDEKVRVFSSQEDVDEYERSMGIYHCSDPAYQCGFRDGEETERRRREKAEKEITEQMRIAALAELRKKAEASARAELRREAAAVRRAKAKRKKPKVKSKLKRKSVAVKAIPRTWMEVAAEYGGWMA